MNYYNDEKYDNPALSKKTNVMVSGLIESTVKIRKITVKGAMGRPSTFRVINRNWEATASDTEIQEAQEAPDQQYVEDPL